MGACCTNSLEVKNEITSLEINSIELITKIQAALRKYLVQKQVPAFEPTCVTMEATNIVDTKGPTNITAEPINQDVLNQIEAVIKHLYDKAQYKLNDPLTHQWMKKKYLNSIEYEGYFDIQKQVRDGWGMQCWPDGSKYLGEWNNDKAHGKGKLTHSNGDIYEGDWVEDKADGFGKFIHADGAIYEGHWKNDSQNGHGKESWPDNSKFEGEYVNGKKNGKGKFCWVDGASYEGDFKDNLLSGVGAYLWQDGRSYTGNWFNNKMHGKGVYIKSKGEKYDGEFVNDKKEGHGVYTW